MKEIKKSESFKSKQKGKDVKFNIDLNYSPEYDSFNIRVKEGEGFMSYSWNIERMPLEVVKKLNNMLEEVVVQADSKYHTKKFDYDYADIGQFSLPDSERNKTEQEYINLGKKITNTKFDGDLTKAYDYVVRKKREFGGDFQSGVYSDGGGVDTEEDIDLTDDNVLRVRKPAMPEKKSAKEWAEKHNSSAYEFMVDKKAFGGFFNKAIEKPKSIDLDDKQVRLKTGEYVQVLDQAGDSLMIMDLGSLGSGAKSRYVKLSDVDMTSFKLGGALIGNQKRIDMNHNGKIDAEDFKLLRSSMNGAWRNERKHVNHSEDYEVRYAKPRPNRTGYKGKRKFATGGMFGENTKVEKYSVYIEYGNEDDNKMKVVELDFPNLQQASNIYKKYLSSNKYKGQDILDIMILKYYENGDFEPVEDKYSNGGYVEITDPKRELFDKGYAIYGGDAWEKLEDVKKIPLPKDAFIVKVKSMNNDYFAIAEKRKFKEGGGISNFERLSRVVAKNYVGKAVKPKYQKEYGKVYSKEEANEVGDKVAGKMKMMKK